MTILFVCSGNIHRSALAEALLRHEALRDGRTDMLVLSAGVIALPGMEAARDAAETARRSGIDLSAHRSRPLTEDLVAGADLIVLMERFHRDWIDAHHPGAASRCRMLSEHAAEVSLAEGIAPGDDVPDGVGGEDESFRRSFSIIQECVRRLYRELPPAPQETYARAIEERFCARRHTALALSPADFALVERWWDRGVPLWIALDTIDDLLRRKEAAGAPSRVRRLSFVAAEVDERFEAYQRSHASAARAGKPETAGGDDAGEPEGDALLSQAAGRLLEAAGDARRDGLAQAAEMFEQVATRITAGRTGPRDSVAARLRLHEIEEELLGSLRRLAAGEELDALRRGAEADLATYRNRMTPAAFEATVHRLVAERIRERYGVPDLSRI